MDTQPQQAATGGSFYRNKTFTTVFAELRRAGFDLRNAAVQAEFSGSHLRRGYAGENAAASSARLDALVFFYPSALLRCPWSGGG